MKHKCSVRILDYGVGNLRSVFRACKFYSDDVQIASTIGQLTNATHVILPGVGAFGVAMEGLREQGFEDAIQTHIKAGRPLLGICVGLQILYEAGNENGLHEGIGIWKGSVVHLRKFEIDNQIRVPNIGWSIVHQTPNGGNSSLLAGLQMPFYAYFAHSYAADVCSTENVVGNLILSERKIPAVIEKGNVFGVQFHPEKSGEVGLQIIKNFLSKSEDDGNY